MARVKCPRCFHINPDEQEVCVKCNAPLPKIRIEIQESDNTNQDPAAAAYLHFRQGQVVANRYTVHNLIGRGGMGCIYKVQDNVLGEFVALKTLLPQFGRDKVVLERFFNEARIARRLAHANIVRVHDIGSSNAQIYISMEYIEGTSLRAILEKTKPGERVPIRQVMKYFDELCAALEYAHRFTIHRDIKPENVMIDKEGSVKLMDFGISKLMANTRLTGASLVMGTPFYMSPEQMKNSRDVDARADIYSVGVMLYEVLTGNLPTGVAKPISQINREIPPVFDAIVDKCVAIDPENRYQNASELRKALRDVAGIVDKMPQFKNGANGQQVQYSKKRRVVGWLLAFLVVSISAASIFAVEYFHANAGSGSTLQNDGTANETMSIAALEQSVSSIREIASEYATLSEERQAIFDIAEATRSMANDLKATQPEDAKLKMLEALESYMAVTVLPDAMVWVPAGEVETNGIKRYVPGFFIDQYEVTLAQYNDFARSVDGGWLLPPALASLTETYGDHPIAQVSFFDAAAYAAWRGVNLPSDKQWARAAYGGEGASRRYPWGDTWQNDAAATSGLWATIGSHPADVTWSGCYDMAGNVAEWTRTPVQPQTTHEDGTTPFFGTQMLVMGGDFTRREIPLNSLQSTTFETRTSTLGFRCVYELNTTPAAIAAFIHYHTNNSHL